VSSPGGTAAPFGAGRRRQVGHLRWRRELVGRRLGLLGPVDVRGRHVEVGHARRFGRPLNFKTIHLTLQLDQFAMVWGIVVMCRVPGSFGPGLFF